MRCAPLPHATGQICRLRASGCDVKGAPHLHVGDGGSGPKLVARIPRFINSAERHTPQTDDPKRGGDRKEKLGKKRGSDNQ